jgi:hypothetical protein
MNRYNFAYIVKIWLMGLSCSLLSYVFVREGRGLSIKASDLPPFLATYTLAFIVAIIYLNWRQKSLSNKDEDIQ